ncbi:MAG: hypothetical protein WBW74_04080, partial [Xanthobacteraceae bacterium]
PDVAAAEAAPAAVTAKATAMTAEASAMTAEASTATGIRGDGDQRNCEQQGRGDGDPGLQSAPRRPAQFRTVRLRP